MIKQLQYFGKTEHGIFAQSLFGSAGAFEKTAGAPAFSDLETGAELQQAVKAISKQDRTKFCYVLVNALGAGEYFGSNINADYFPWNALAHEGDDYGYKTFLKAHAFSHHKNKDPERAFGVPIVSLLNPRMKRVELIIKLDREKAKLEGADGIISRIDAGEFPDVSMGCKVPFDVCSICGNHSKTKDDYCKHMRPDPEDRDVMGPNKILKDGRRICVLNTIPRFFDISFVFIGADKTAKVMMKLASAGSLWTPGAVVLSADAGAKFYAGMQKVASAEPVEEMEKVAHVFGLQKQSAQEKFSEMLKSIPAGTFAMKRLSGVEKKEPTISKKKLEKMSSHPLSAALGATAAMGIVLKPEEFQHLVLSKMGEAEFADELSKSNQVFRKVASFQHTAIEFTKEAMADVVPLLEDVVSERTAFGEAFLLRSVSSEEASKNPLPTPSPVEHSLLDKISAAYNGYRRSLMMKMSQAAEMVQSDPRLRESILGDGLVNMFSKTASRTPVVTLDSVSYMMGAHFSDRGLLSNPATAEAIAASNKDLLNDGELSAQGF